MIRLKMHVLQNLKMKKKQVLIHLIVSKQKRKNQKKKKIKNENPQIDDVLKNKKIKTMIDFDKNECNSIKSIIVKGDTNIDVTSHFIKGKMLMFAKLSLKSFVYEMIDVFCFPNDEIKQII